MPHQLVCDSCRRVLHVPDDVTEVVLTCPRCLAKVVNPDVVLRTAPAATESAAPPSTCPGCGRGVEAAWRYCPSCNWALQRQAAPPAAWTASADEDVAFDTRGTGLGLVVLAVLGGVGVGVFYLGGGFDLVRAVPGGLVIAGVGGLFLVIALAAIVLLRTPSQSTSAGVARGFMGGIAITVTLGVVFLALLFAAVVSAVVTVVQTCADSCGPPAQKAPAKK